MKRALLGVAGLILLASPLLAQGKPTREQAEAAWFRGYYLETGKRDPKAARQAYEDAAWLGEEWVDIGVRAYLGLARTTAALGGGDAKQFLDSAVKYFESGAEHLSSETRAALKSEIDETAARLAEGGREKSLDEQIRHQLEILRDYSANSAPGKAAAKTLELYGARAVPLLAKELADTNPAYIRVIAGTLATIGTADAAEALRAAVFAPDCLYPEQIGWGILRGSSEPMEALRLDVLEHPDERTRWTAASGSWSDRLRFAAARRMLADDSTRIRERGRYELQCVQTGGVEEGDHAAVLGLLEHGNPLVRQAALKLALGVGGDPAVRAVSIALGDADPGLVESAVKAIQHEDVPWRDELCAGLVKGALTALAAESGDRSGGVGFEVNELLGAHRFAGGYEPLLPLVRAEAERSAPVTNSLFVHLVTRLGWDGGPPRRFACEGYGVLPTDAHRAVWLSKFAKSMGDDALSAAREGIQSANKDLRAASAAILLAGSSPGDWPDLAPLLADEDHRVREAAACAMLRRDGAAAIEPLGRFLAKDPGRTAAVLATARETLGEEGVRTVLNTLLRVAPAALRPAFEAAGDAATDEQILAALRTRDPSVVPRTAALAADRHLLEAWPLLLEMQQFTGACHALESLRSYYLGLREYREVKEVLEGDAFEKARALAGEASPALRVAACHGLAALGDRRAIGLLLDLVRDDDPGVRDAASIALQKLATTGGAKGE